MPADDLATTADLARLRGELRDDFGRLRGEFGELRGEVRGELRSLRMELGGLRSDVRAEIAEKLRVQTWSLMGVLVAAIGIVAAIGA